MKDKIILLAIGFVVGIVVTFIASALIPDTVSLGGATRYPHGYLDTADGYYVDGTAIIDGSGNVDGTITTGSISVDAGTTINEFNCTSNTDFNPGAIASSSPEFVEVSITGVASGDYAFATLATNTTLLVGAIASTTDTIRVQIYQPDGDLSAVNLGTTTLKTCYIGF